MIDSTKIKFDQLFPDKYCFLIFMAYVGLYTNYGLVITASQKYDNGYSYNVVTVVLLTEALKLISSLVLYLKSSPWSTLVENLKSNKKLFLLYLIPSFLYCVFNNLTFHSLSSFDPTTYLVIFQLRVMVIGILFQILFKKNLTSQQWIALMLLTIGCVMKQFSKIEKGFYDLASEDSKNPLEFYHRIFQLKNGFVFIQIICSSLAGVYTEKLLKETGAEVHILIQNIFMYVDSIFWNAGFLCINGTVEEAFTYTSLLNLCNVTVIIIILNNAAVGIVTSYFLRKMNSIMKNFAAACDLILTAVLAWVIFGIPVDVWTFFSIFVVILAIVLYSQNPVVNRGRIGDTSEKSSI